MQRIFNGEAAKAARIKKGLTLKEVAVRFGVDHNTILNHESGRRNPNLETVQKYLELYGVTADELLNLPFRKISHAA